MADGTPVSTQSSPGADGPSRSGVETTGLETIAESERHGTPRSLFWPWFAANVSVLGIGYGSFVLGFGISFWQATIVGIIGIVVSFLFCGIIALAGKRGSAPTMVLSRAIFGVRGARLVSFLSWVLTVGWETVLTVLAVLATNTVLLALGFDGGVGTKVVALVIVAALIVTAGIFGFHLIMRLQRVITIVTAAVTVIYIIIVAVSGHIDIGAVMSIPAGAAPAVIGALVFMMTGFGLGWVNAAADYSRYLPRNASSGGVVWWTAFGSALAPVVLLVFGLLLAGSSAELNDAIYNDPVGALSTILPIWFLIPFILVAVLGLVGGAVLDIYSSGLALLSTGLKVPRPVAAGIDGIIMILGSIYVVFFADSFFFPFQGFLITLGVPIAAWCGTFIADVILRKRDYAETELYDKKGRYGDVRWLPVLLVVIGTAVGWGLVTNTYAEWLGWQGYLLGPIGGKEGDWAFANLGVLASLLIGFLGYLIFGSRAVRKQESR